jgi:hypothetical protein
MAERTNEQLTADVQFLKTQVLHLGTQLLALIREVKSINEDVEKLLDTLPSSEP